jgi:hypothetical protein
MPADPRRLSSGLPDDFEGVIVDAKFLFDDRFVDDDDEPICQLQLTIHSDDPDIEDQTPFYACGPGWEPVEKGAGARKADDPDNDEVNFNGNTKVGRLITAIVKCGGEAEVVRRYTDDGVGSTDAAMFAGLGPFHWARVTKPYKFKDRDGKEVSGESEQLLPDKYLAEAAPKKKGGRKAAPKKAEPVEAVEAVEEKATEEPTPVTPRSRRGKSAGNGDGAGLTDDVRATVSKVFDENEDFGFKEWLEACIAELGDQAKSKEVMTWLTSTAEDGAWEQLNADPAEA